MENLEIYKKISTFKDIYNHFGGNIGFFINDKKVSFFVENSKFGTPNDIKLGKYDFLYYFTDKIDLPVENITKEIERVLETQKELL